MTMASVSIAPFYRIGTDRLGAMENQMTAEGLEALRAEIAELEGPARRAIAEEIKTARGFGDLKENAEYHEAKNAQARLETKILQLRQRLGDARVVEAAHGDVVGFGSTVELEDEATGKRVTYTLVAGHEASAGEGKLSAESPMATALDGLKSGDVAVVRTPRGERRLKVIAVRLARKTLRRRASGHGRSGCSVSETTSPPTLARSSQPVAQRRCVGRLGERRGGELALADRPAARGHQQLPAEHDRALEVRVRGHPRVARRLLREQPAGRERPAHEPGARHLVGVLADEQRAARPSSTEA